MNDDRCSGRRTCSHSTRAFWWMSGATLRSCSKGQKALLHLVLVWPRTPRIIYVCNGRALEAVPSKPDHSRDKHQLAPEAPPMRACESRTRWRPAAEAPLDGSGLGCVVGRRPRDSVLSLVTPRANGTPSKGLCSKRLWTGGDDLQRRRA